MSIVSRGRMWWRAVFHSAREDTDLQREMAAHIAMEEARLTRSGLSPDDAHRRAMIAFGGVERQKEAVRDERRTPVLGILSQRLVQDVAYALRVARRDWAFTTIVIATFAVGIGANTAMFTVINAVLLQPLPYQEPDRLVDIRSVAPAAGGLMSAPDFPDYAQRNRTFTSMTIWGRSDAVVSGAGDPNVSTWTSRSTSSRLWA